MNKFNNVISELLRSIGKKTSVDQLNKNLSLKTDLGFDSILIVQLAISLSENYDIDLEDCEIESWVTLADVHNNLKSLGCAE